MEKYVTQAVSDNVASELEKKSLEVALKAARESIVLLKNNSNLLPLKTKSVAVYGPGGQYTIKGGLGSGEVNDRLSYSIVDGFKYLNVDVLNDRYLRDYENEYNKQKEKYMKDNTISLLRITKIMEVMNNVFQLPNNRSIREKDLLDLDVAIYVVSRQSSEGGDRKLEKYDLSLTEQEIQDLNFLKRHDKKVVLVLNTASYIDLSSIEDLGIESILFVSLLGTMGGVAIAETILGLNNPSGKLTDTWPFKYEDIPYGNTFSYLNLDTSRVFYKEGIYVGYRYFDTFNVPVRFPFGFGMSYSSFTHELFDVKLVNNKVLLKVKVTNNSTVLGKEVLEIYATLPVGKLDKENKRLVAFSKTKELEENESEILSFEIELYSLSSFRESDSSYILEKGEYAISFGSNLNLVQIACLVVVDNEITVSKTNELLLLKAEYDELKSKRVETTYDSSILRLKVNTKEIKTKTYHYHKMIINNSVSEMIDSLTEEELISLVVGTGTSGMMKVIGNTTPGAVGRTTDSLLKKGIVNINLADGPAGVRILRRSAIINDKIKMKDFMVSFLEFLPSYIKKFMMVKPSDKLLYQNCTAFPVASALAASFNKEIVKEVGIQMGEEMKKYQITFILGPAMNIHRNPLCGRNFEYYSEDPVLSGEIASSIIDGIQSTPGVYATIKHFALNNQEENRFQSDSIASPRAIREIYLKGYEIAIKKANPRSVMSSYNKINGTYASNNYELLVDILRNEFEFTGLVMTDWYATKKEQADTIKAITSGVDLVMPGGNYYKKEIERGVKKGLISLDQLKLVASNVLASIIDSYAQKTLEDKICDKE